VIVDDRKRRADVSKGGAYAKKQGGEPDCFSVKMIERTE
jgi:hypothetical protein